MALTKDIIMSKIRETYFQLLTVSQLVGRPLCMNAGTRNNLKYPKKLCKLKFALKKILIGVCYNGYDENFDLSEISR